MDFGDILFTNEAYQFVSKYIAPEMIIVIPVLIFINWLMRQTPNFKNWLIPYIMTFFGVVAGVAITKSIEDGFIQGVLVSAIAILIPLLIAQMKKKKQDAEKAAKAKAEQEKTEGETPKYRGPLNRNK